MLLLRMGAMSMLVVLMPPIQLILQKMRNGEEVFIGLEPFGINSNNDIKINLMVLLLRINSIFLQIFEHKR